MSLDQIVDVRVTMPENEADALTLAFRALDRIWRTSRDADSQDDAKSAVSDMMRALVRRGYPAPRYGGCDGTGRRL